MSRRRKLIRMFAIYDHNFDPTLGGPRVKQAMQHRIWVQLSICCRTEVKLSL
jgi:hypothetical protein